MTIHDVIESHADRATDADLLEVVAGRKARALTLDQVAAASPAELQAAGVPVASARRLVCAAELGRRISSAKPPQVRIGSAEQAAAHFRSRIGYLDHEAFEVAVLDVRLRVLSTFRVAEGTGWSCAVHPRDALRPVIVDKRGAAVVFSHNHPSGDPTPSQEDRELTRRLLRAGELFGLRIVDHVIVTPAVAFSSFRELGLLDV